MAVNCKNYTDQGGDRTVIGGTLEFADGAVIENFPGATKQSDSTATDVAGLVADFNSLLAALRTEGILKS